MVNKRGQEGGTSLATIIGIILLLIVAVLIIFAVTGGFGDFGSKIKQYFGGGSNVQSVIQACELACNADQQYDFCELKRSVKFEKDSGFAPLTATVTCKDLSTGAIKDSNNKEYKISLACNRDCPSATP